MNSDKHLISIVKDEQDYNIYGSNDLDQYELITAFVLFADLLRDRYGISDEVLSMIITYGLKEIEEYKNNK